MQATTVEGTHIHYRLAGRDAGPMLVFVNSLGTDWRVWETVADILGTRSRLLFHDKRGHGLSDVTEGELRIDDHVADLATLLDELKIDDAIVCGLSVGGMIALGLAGSRPDLVRGLVLCDTGHRIGTPERWNQRIDVLRREGMAAIADGVMELWFTPAFRETRPAETALWRNMLVRTPTAGYAATCAAIRDADLGEAARSVRVPTLCLCGTSDQATPPELMHELAGLIAGSGYRDIPGAAHLPTVEAPDAVAGAISDFLSEHALV